MVDKGHFILHSYAKPPVTAGRYQLHATQPGSGVVVEAYDGEVYVSSPRYVMPPDQILSTFPPAMAEGDFGGRLPQIAIKRRTLPWERRPDQSRPLNEEPPVPWLALVVIAEGEGSVSPEPRPVVECITPGTPPLPEPTDVDSATGYYLTVTETVVNKVFPTIEDLPLLVHVREVDVTDTELAAGDDDGWLAVILANRLPIAVPQPDGRGGTITKPVKYLACLVNLEGQLGVLPTTQVTDDFLELTAAVQDVRLVSQAASHTDLVSMGTGTTFTAAKGAGGLVSIGQPLPAAESAPIDAATSWTKAGATFHVEPASVNATAGVRMEMASGFAIDFERFIAERTYRFPVLAHWSFTSVNEGDFRSLMQALDVGLIGTQFGTVLDSTGEHPNVPGPNDPPRPAVPDVAETGHIALPQTTRRGDPASAWFRGPLSPHPTDRDPATVPPAHMSDELRTVTPDGREDVSLAAAFEIGRLLALSQPSLTTALTRWRREQFGAARAQRVGALLSQNTALPLDALVRKDLGRIIGLELMTITGRNAENTVGPARPLVDPGRTIELAGALDAVVAAGLGLDLGALEETASTRGMAHALAVTQPLTADSGGLEGRAVTGLRNALATELSKISNTATPSRAIPKGRTRTPVVARDALDDLLDGAPRGAFEATADQSEEDDS